MSTVLYSYFRSSCSWRLRIALALKNIPYEYKAVNLLKNEQNSAEHKERCPSGSLPVLQMDGMYFSQSLAAIEYLDETKPGVKLLPEDPIKRFQARKLAYIVACDIQPVQNLKVLRKHGLEHKQEWGRWAVESGFAALETELKSTAGKYCVGDEVTIADICLVPQVYNAKRFEVDLSQYPTICRIVGALEDLPAFQSSHPNRQPDCPEEERIKD